jgi:quercetin dioxygenase-like cupin family protein
MTMIRPLRIELRPQPDPSGGTMESWDISTLDVQPHNPAVLDSEQEGRAIVIHLSAGQRLQEHQVHERAWLVVVSGAIEIEDSGGESISGGPGLLVIFDPNERREVRATDDSRILLLLSPWPGEGHPSQR